jgi:hypothetical protein
VPKKSVIDARTKGFRAELVKVIMLARPPKRTAFKRKRRGHTATILETRPLEWAELIDCARPDVGSTIG